jgi:hypothetical protein
MVRCHSSLTADALPGALPVVLGRSLHRVVLNGRLFGSDSGGKLLVNIPFRHRANFAHAAIPGYWDQLDELELLLQGLRRQETFLGAASTPGSEICYSRLPDMVKLPNKTADGINQARKVQVSNLSTM